MAFIHKYSTISNGDTFNNGVLNNTVGNTIIYPDYKKTIPGVNLRRMSAIVKMGLANTIKCLNGKKVDAVVVGTGLGSIHHTELFLSSFVNTEQSILSPTPFINSVHNTISGEIALHTKNQGYNATYSQGGLSFEGALLDAILLTKENKNVIIGGVDESTPVLEKVLNKMKAKRLFTSGSSFFNLSPDKKNSLAEVINCTITKRGKLISLLDSFNYNPQKDFILSGHSTCNYTNNLKTLNYSNYSGVYMTNSSYGLQLAVEILNTSDIAELDGYTFPENLKRIFIINHSSNHDIGVVIIKK